MAANKAVRLTPVLRAMEAGVSPVATMCVRGFATGGAVVVVVSDEETGVAADEVVALVAGDALVFTAAIWAA